MFLSFFFVWELFVLTPGNWICIMKPMTPNLSFHPFKKAYLQETRIHGLASVAP